VVEAAVFADDHNDMLDGRDGLVIARLFFFGLDCKCIADGELEYRNGYQPGPGSSNSCEGEMLDRH